MKLTHPHCSAMKYLMKHLKASYKFDSFTIGKKTFAAVAFIPPTI